MTEKPKDQTERDDQDLFQEDWLEPPDNDDFPDIDPDLESLRPQINWFRPVLMIVVMIFAGYVSLKFEEQITFFFSDPTPIDIGDITEYSAKSRADPNWEPNIPHNRVVSLSGIPDHEKTSIACSANPPSRFYKLIGAHIYVQIPMDEGMSAIACKAERKKGDVFENAPMLDGYEGRALSFTETRAENLQGFKQFYERTTGDLFCSSMTEAKREARINLLRQVLREKYKAQNKEYPSDEVLEDLLSKETICYHAYMIQGEKKPNDFWHFFAVVIILGLIMIWNVVALVLWTRKLIRMTRGN